MDKKILVVEVIKYKNIPTGYSIKKSADSLDEAIELCTELGLSINDAEIIRTNSTRLVIYNPKNLAERIKGMKNRNISREEKIAARLKYNQQQSQQ